MKTKLTLAALAVTLAAPAFAQSFDVATATCGEFAALDADTMGTMLLWIDGYTGGVAGDTTLDLDRLKQNITDAMALCAEDPAKPVLDAMSEASLEQ